MQAIPEIEDIPSSANTSIRYIRDWVNGSDSNGGNHWVEIEAIETETGYNRAL